MTLEGATRRSAPAQCLYVRSWVPFALQDLQESGAPLAVILAAGEWKSRVLLVWLLCTSE